jgi:hypothetical protein
MRGHSFFHVAAQFVPIVGLRENALRETLGDIAAIRLLGDFKDDFAHVAKLKLSAPWEQGRRLHPMPTKLDNSHGPQFVPRLQELAARKGIGYQPYIKLLLREALERESRRH